MEQIVNKNNSEVARIVTWKQTPQLQQKPKQTKKKYIEFLLENLFEKTKNSPKKLWSIKSTTKLCYIEGNEAMERRLESLTRDFIVLIKFDVKILVNNFISEDESCQWKLCIKDRNGF